MTIVEKELIAQIRRTATRLKNPAIRTGIGDDCAVLRLLSRRSGKDQGSDVLVTTDFSLEGIHFQLQWHPPESIGHRCLARGLSDIAAMGGEPVAAFLSLALPRKIGQSWVNRFVHGLIRLAERYGVALAGGDTSESPNGILADIVVVGTSPSGNAVQRSGARPGDLLYVSGELGCSAAAIAELRKKPTPKLNTQEYPRHFFPEPRIALGRTLREKGLPSAMIDTSDGLSTDLAHICEESGVGAELYSGAIPRASVGKPARQVDPRFALHGGEDYELLFTARPKWRVPSRIAGVQITQIGQIKRGKQILLMNPRGAASPLIQRGWEHFRK